MYQDGEPSKKNTVLGINESGVWPGSGTCAARTARSGGNGAGSAASTFGQLPSGRLLVDTLKCALAMRHTIVAVDV